MFFCTTNFKLMASRKLAQQLDTAVQGCKHFPFHSLPILRHALLNHTVSYSTAHEDETGGIMDATAARGMENNQLFVFII